MDFGGQQSRSAYVLAGARLAQGPRTAEHLDLEIHGDKIARFHPPAEKGVAGDFPALHLQGHLILPGLINAHDHLEFNLFPRLGNGPYPSAQAWAKQIYRPNESPVKEHLRIPKPQRLMWGGLKNLLSGVTTVCHHNPYEEELFDCDFPVRVVKDFGWAHSLQFSPDLASRFRETPPDRPFILHLGEATDAAGRDEIFQLDAMGALDDRTVLVHAVALDAEGLSLARRRRASIIWCPSANLFTLGQTLSANVLSSDIPVALGTDSAMTAEGDLLDELRVAARTSGLENDRLYSMVTDGAARILRLDRGEGTLAEGGVADLIAVQDGGSDPCDALLDLKLSDLSMVIVSGEIQLLSASFAERVPAPLIHRFHRIEVGSERSCLVKANVLDLIASAKAALGASACIRLAGKTVHG